MKNQKYDLHTHLFTTWKKGRFSLERAPREPSYILDAVESAGIDGIALVNFADNRYEDFACESRLFNMLLGQWKVADELKNALVFGNDEGKKIAVIRGEEISTTQGHILALGMEEEDNLYPANDLESISRRVKDSGAILIADHPFNIAGIGKQTLLERADLFNGFERYNANFKSLPLGELDEIETKTGLWGIAVSDSHNRTDIGAGYLDLEEGLDFSSADNLKGSLKEKIKNKKFTLGMRRASMSGSLAHKGLVAYDIARRKLGLL